MAKPIGYTGYYPGEKIPRAPTGRPAPYIPNEYDLNALSEAIGDMYFNFGDVPSYVRDQLNKGLSLSLSANIYAGHLEAENLQAYSEAELKEERGELSGVAGFSISLDPREILKDPGKWAKAMPEQIKKQLTSLSDLELKKRGNLWANIVGVETDNGIGWQYKAMESLQLGETFLKVKEKGVAPSTGNVHPLAIGHLKIVDSKGKERKIGLAAAQSIVDFQSDVASVFFRDTNFDKVLKATFAGASTALAEGVKSGQIVAGSSDQAQQALAFVAQTDLANQMANFGSNNKSSTNTLATVVARLNQEESPIDKDGNPLTLKGTIKGIQTEIDTARAHLAMIREGTGKLSTAQRGLIGEDTVKLYESITTASVLSKPEILALEPQFRAFEKMLDNLQKTIDGPLPTTAMGRNMLLRSVSAITMNVGKGNALQHGIERAFLRKMAEDFVAGKRLGSGDLQRLEDFFPPGSDGHTLLRNMRIMLPTLERDRMYFGMDDFLDVFYSDKVITQFLWVAKISPRLQALTPDYYVKQFMTRMNYFGLIIEDKTLLMAGQEVNPKFFLYKWMNKVIRNNKMFANTFSISVTGLGKFKVAGGAHFAAIKSLEELKGLWEKDPQFMIKIITNPQYAVDFLKFEFGNNSEVGNFLRDKFHSMEDLEEWAKGLTEKLQKFHDWVVTKGKEFGIDILDPKHMENLIQALHLYDIDKIKNLGRGITKTYLGLMEKFTQKLSILQNKIFKGVLGKVAGYVVGWKMVVSHAIATTLTGVITALTGGLGGFAAGAIEKVIQFVSRIFLDTFEKIVLSIFKGDFKEFYKFFEESLYNLMKWFAWAAGIIGFGTAIVVMIPMMVILGAFSSQDNSKIGAIGSGGSGGGIPGEPPIIVDPIFGEECEATLACVSMQALIQNGFKRVVDTNLTDAANVLRTLIPQYPHFEVARFIRVMEFNAGPPVPNPDNKAGLGIGAFQCIGYSIASDPDLPTSPDWRMLYEGTQSECRKITPESAGLDDHIVFPLKNGHYHIGVLVTVREDGSAVMYDVNTDGNGSLHQWSIINLVEFVAGNNPRNPGKELTVLRCP